MNDYIIYKHKNMINGKVYIGKTCQKPEKRYGSNGIGYRACPYFYNAIQKYGWNNFEHEILFSGLNKEEANEKESQMIKEYNSRDPKFGYNIRYGGDGFTSEDSKLLWSNPKYRETISKANREKWNDEKYHNERAKLYKEQWKDPIKRERRSKQAIERWADEEFHKKAYQAVLKSCSTSVKCVETNEIFDAIVDACKKYGVHHSNLIRAIRKGCRCGGMHWKYA
jgi:group I intron endonuclease